MSEDTSDGFADQPRPMYLCLGCGFHVEREDVRSNRIDIEGTDVTEHTCGTCAKCVAHPDLRESYRRGFDAGADMMRRRVQSAIRGR